MAPGNESQLDSDGAPAEAVTDLATLHLPAALRYLSLVRATTLELCEQVGMAAPEAAQLEMAVDEACANIIEHSYHGGASAEEEPTHPGFHVRYALAPEYLTVELRDFGEGFDPEGADFLTPSEYLATRNERGLGLYIIRSFVDRMEYTRSAEHGNTLRLTKRR